jgi:hypothetical protein
VGTALKAVDGTSDTANLAPRAQRAELHIPWDVLRRAAVVLAVVTAFGELLVRLADLNYRHIPFGAGPRIVWMAPLMNLIWSGDGLLLVIIGRRIVLVRAAPSTQSVLSIHDASADNRHYDGHVLQLLRGYA